MRQANWGTTEWDGTGRSLQLELDSIGFLLLLRSVLNECKLNIDLCSVTDPSILRFFVSCLAVMMNVETRDNFDGVLKSPTQLVLGC